MGVTTFLERLEAFHLNQLREDEIPRGLDPTDGAAVRAWFKKAFAYWLLEHRDDLMGREWVRRGWAEHVLRPTKSGDLKDGYRVKPEAVQLIDDWMQDRID